MKVSSSSAIAASSYVYKMVIVIAGQEVYICTTEDHRADLQFPVHSSRNEANCKGNIRVQSTYDPSVHRLFAPLFSEMFRTLTILQKDVSHLNHISERRFAPKTYLRNIFCTHFVIRKDISPPLHIQERRFSPFS